MKCSACKSPEVPVSSTSEHTIRVGPRSFVTQLPSQVCPTCGESTFQLADVGRFERAVARALALSGAHDGHALRFMRKSIPLRASELATILGLTPETISRWENHERLPDVLVMAIVGSMILEGPTSVIARLDGLFSEPTSQPVQRLELAS